MDKSSSAQLCPICKKPSKMTRKWVKNSSGTRYEYKVYHHNGILHRVNAHLDTSRRVHKDEVRKDIVRLINSTHFKHAIFTVKDLIEALQRTSTRLKYSEVSRTLFRLVDAKLILVVRKGRAIHFINTPQNGKLNYSFMEVSIELNDTENNNLFTHHKYKTKILNDNQYPLSYLQFRAVGDNERSKSQVAIRAHDESNNENAIVYYLEDAPLEKRIIVEFNNPVPPGEERAFSIEYSWPELEGPSYTFTTSTNLRKLSFSLVSKQSFILSVARTNQSQTAREDASERVSFKRDRNERNVAKFEDIDVQPFVVFKFKWTRTAG